MDSQREGIYTNEMQATQATPSPIVHLELHTGNLARACGFYSRLFGWRIDRIDAGPHSYQAFDWGGEVEGGVVECGTERPLWLPYVEVASIQAATAGAKRAGASVLLEAREGPSGWRSIVTVPDGAEVALWQPK
jgi:predicted enzyme related to lactoylglutathione lyase